MTINIFIRLLIGISSFPLSSGCSADQIETKTRFKLHLIEEPGRILPQFKDRFTGQYLQGNVFDSYYKIDGANQLKPSMMKKCVWMTSTKLTCTLAKRKWANGESITAQHYYDHLKSQLQKDSLSSAKEIMSELKNYAAYLKGEKKFSAVGFKLNKKQQLVFQTEKPNRDFLYQLTHPVLSPIPKPELRDDEIAKLYATGPYKLREWKRGRSILLERNSEHPIQVQNAPLVELFFIAEDYTALNLYEKGQLDFLRRLSTQHIPRFKKTNQLMTVTFFRMDYLGFGPSLLNEVSFRKKLQSSFNGAEFLKVFSSTGAPVGCVGLPSSLQKNQNCLKLKKQDRLEKHPRVRLHFSKQGGESMARSMEWFQSQWKKNIGASVELVSDDVKMLGAQIRSHPPDMFRRGVPLSRPTCLAALEVFETHSPDNFIQFSQPQYDKVISSMKKPQTKKSKLKSLCSQGIQLLLDSGLLIPLGEVQYSMLNNGKFKGFTVNGLNQMDLSRLVASE